MSTQVLCTVFGQHSHGLEHQQVPKWRRKAAWKCQDRSGYTLDPSYPLLTHSLAVRVYAVKCEYYILISPVCLSVFARTQSPHHQPPPQSSSLSLPSSPPHNNFSFFYYFGLILRSVSNMSVCFGLITPDTIYIISCNVFGIQIRMSVCLIASLLVYVCAFAREREKAFCIVIVYVLLLQYCYYDYFRFFLFFFMGDHLANAPNIYAFSVSR